MIDDAPPGIPPMVWQAQTTDTEVEPTNRGWPGAQAIALSMPLKYTRPWRLVCEPITDISGNGGTDRLLANFDPNIGALPLTNLGVVPPAVPSLPPPAALTSGIRLVLSINTQQIVADYPARGAVYSINGENINASVFQIQIVAGPGLLRPIKCRVRLQDGFGATYDRPTLTLAYANVSNANGDNLSGAVPPRAVAVRLVPNDDTVSFAPPFFPAPPTPAYSMVFYSTTGEIVESRATGEYPRPWWTLDEVPVPTDAAFIVVYRMSSAGGNWIAPRLVWRLSL